MLRRSILNFLVDVVTLLAIFAMVATRLGHLFCSATRHRRTPRRRGPSRPGPGCAMPWGDVHFCMSSALGVLLVVHVALHLVMGLHDGEQYVPSQVDDNTTRIARWQTGVMQGRNNDFGQQQYARPRVHEQRR